MVQPLQQSGDIRHQRCWSVGMTFREALAGFKAWRVGPAGRRRQTRSAGH